MISMLAEDILSFAKAANSEENLADQLDILKSLTEEDNENYQEQPASLLCLDQLLQTNGEEELEQTDDSHLTRYGRLQGDYLLDFS